MAKDRVLIIEDDLDIAELVQDYLGIRGFDADIVTNGREGYEKAVSEFYDLVILDIMLPGMDGFEVCKRLRANSQVPILIVSAKGTDVDVIRGLGIGADDYVSKPFSPNQLVARVEAHLKRYRDLVQKGSDDNSLFLLGDLKVDFDSRQVYRNEEEIALTNKEFSLLEFFIKNPNKVFSREFLFNRIWDMNSFGDISTVTVHIKRLREKIEPDSSLPPYIETVWGAGYRFNIKK